jgi:hypothetical protein
LADSLLRAVAEQGYTEPTPIQLQAIPVILSGRDILRSANRHRQNSQFYFADVAALEHINANASNGWHATDTRTGTDPNT